MIKKTINLNTKEIIIIIIKLLTLLSKNNNIVNHFHSMLIIKEELLRINLKGSLNYFNKIHLKRPQLLVIRISIK